MYSELQSDTFEYLSVEDVELIHFAMLQLFGGLSGRDKNNLEGILSLPMSGYGSYERFPTIEQKAAAYHYYLASGHGFKDGNKRTSFASAAMFLEMNDYEISATDEDVYNWTLEIAKKKEERPPFEDAVEWMRLRINKKPFELI